MSRTLLIIDDDRELSELVRELLRGEGLDVESHHTGSGAVDLAAGGDYALVTGTRPGREDTGSVTAGKR